MILFVYDSLRAFNLIFIIITRTDNKVVGFNILKHICFVCCTLTIRLYYTFYLIMQNIGL